MPLSTLQETPRDVPSKTRGQDGFATSFPVGLLHPLQHAGCSENKGGQLKDTSDDCIRDASISHDFNVDPESPETFEMMMSAPLPSALLRCCFGTTKGCVLLEHPVE